MTILKRLELEPEVQVEEVYPVDDIRHCPKWMRLTEAAPKKIINKPVKRTWKLPAGQLKRVNVFRKGEKIFNGTYMEVSEKFEIPFSTLCKNVTSGLTNRRTGLRFKKAMRRLE